MLADFRLDTAGVREVLRGPEVRALVDQVAAEVAAHARAQVPAGIPVEVRPYTTDRGAASVVIAHPRGMALQATHGVLTRAAGAARLEVKEWGAR
ncbi:hypothetical protein [Streptomyces aureoversilis]|uniref:Uncharacterized protein n=1 Tax=Streptomyces aureoversilis TaxID=67277 RepID=A0ABV9ZSK4_9ACTN